MPSIKNSIVIVATALFIGARAQYTIDPDNVPLATRNAWCQSQLTTCPLLCLQNTGGASSTTSENDCDATTLTYDCVCGNGLAPNASEFTQTLPYFICTEYGNECVTACNGDSTCQSACRTDHPCGAQNPTRVNTTTSSTMTATGTGAGTTSTGAVVYTGLGGAATTTASSSDTKKSGSDAALDLGRSYGLGVVFISIFAGFALVM